MWPMASLLTSTTPTGYGGAGGSETPPWVSCMYIWYQSVPVPSPAPPLPKGWLEGPPVAAWVLLPPVEAGSPLWQGVDDFPLGLEAVVFLLWPEVGGRPLWFGVGACPLPPGAGWALSGSLPEALMDGALVWAGFGSGLLLG